MEAKKAYRQELAERAKRMQRSIERQKPGSQTVQEEIPESIDDPPEVQEVQENYRSA